MKVSGLVAIALLSAFSAAAPIVVRTDNKLPTPPNTPPKCGGGIYTGVGSKFYSNSP
jgi:hypothetical protein